MPATKTIPLVVNPNNVDSILFRTITGITYFNLFHKPLDMDFESMIFIQNR